MWLINLSLAEWQSLSDDDKALNAQMRLDWLASYSKASEAILQHWFWKLLKSKTQNFAPLHHVFVRVKSSSPNCGSEAWTEIFLLYPLTGASIAHKLLARGLQKCLLLTGDSPEACSDDITRINTSVSQLSHLQDMSVRDVFALVILMGLYLSTASGHQKAYKELLGTLCVWAPTLLTTTLITESPLLCLSVLRCLLFLGAYRTSSLEGYLFGGLFAWRAVLFCVCDFVFLFLSPWLDQLSLRYQMVYAIFWRS
jgi:hypothetical protein